MPNFKCHFLQPPHNDIKPNNLAWNCFSNKLSKSKISIIDFNSSINLGIKTVKDIHGNSYYSSIASKQGKIPEAKDEIESVIYSLIKLNKKILPWMENETIQIKDKIKLLKRLIEQKLLINIYDYLPKELKIIGDIYNEIRNIKTDSFPNYFLFKNKLLKSKFEILKNKEEKFYFFLEKKYMI